MARYSSTLNQFIAGDELTPVASAARTTSSDSGWLNCEKYSTLRLILDVTARSGTSPTLDVTVFTADDSSGTNARAATGSPFAQKTNVAAERKTFTGLDAYYRVAWTVGGTTPSFTFSVSGIGK